VIHTCVVSALALAARSPSWRDVENSGERGYRLGDRVTATLDSVAYEAGDREVLRTAIFALARQLR
jgi:hypothetical protein